ncbi:MAG: serine hydrolase, partial [Clostridia bacterium]|nr:serine hydrolase [Clostridia bacterium]
MNVKIKEYGLSAAAILRYLKRFDEIGGENHGMIVIKDGKKVFEKYCYPYTADMPHTMFSVTKCLVSTAVGFAVDEKKLSLTDKILPYFKEYRHNESKEWDEMTV